MIPFSNIFIKKGWKKILRNNKKKPKKKRKCKKWAISVSFYLKVIEMSEIIQTHFFFGFVYVFLKFFFKWSL